jgi:Uma2 family endonuclease
MDLSEVIAMVTSTMVPLEEYLRTSYDYDREWVDGYLKERGMPDEFHSAIQQFFFHFFGNLKSELGVRVRPDLRVQVSAKNFRIPDVTLLRADAPFSAIAKEPPVLCVEVLSVDDLWSDLEDKIDDYVAMGVGAIWIVDPRKRKMWIADGQGAHAVDEFALSGTSARVTRSELFAELDVLEQRS